MPNTVRILLPERDAAHLSRHERNVLAKHYKKMSIVYVSTNPTTLLEHSGDCALHRPDVVLISDTRLFAPVQKFRRPGGVQVPHFCIPADRDVPIRIED